MPRKGQTVPVPTPESAEPGVVQPYWTTTDGDTVRLYLGNTAEVMARMEPKSVQMIVTSPPYWGLRDYGTGTWNGGEADCDHKRIVNPLAGVAKSGLEGGKKTNGHQQEPWLGGICGRCGAKRIDQQLGSEPSPDCGTHGQAQCGRCFVCSMVGVFRAAREVLRDDGTLWLNLGDSYASSGTGGPQTSAAGSSTFNGGSKHVGKAFGRAPSVGMPAGNLVGIPWRVALALQADGWVLRSDMPWVKRSPMPESVKNRPAKSLEYVFLFSKSMDYFFDMEAVKPKAVKGSANAGSRNYRPNAANGRIDAGQTEQSAESGRSYRQTDLWYESASAPWGMVGVDDELVGVDMTSQGYEGAHFATFPERLITPMIKAGTSEKGCCGDCGAPWRRVTEEKQLLRERPNEYVKRTGEEGTGNSCANTVAGVEVKTIGWQPSCECHGRFVSERKVVAKSTARVTGGNRNDEGDAGASPREEGEKQSVVVRYVSELPLEDHPVVPCRVLDPFIGSGTTCCVSLGLGRHSSGIDLSEQYLLVNAVTRIEGELGSRPSVAWLRPRKQKPIF